MDSKDILTCIMFFVTCSLLLLVNGEIVYLGDAQTAVSYFEDLGFKSGLGQNPADFLGAFSVIITMRSRCLLMQSVTVSRYTLTYAYIRNHCLQCR